MWGIGGGQIYTALPPACREAVSRFEAVTSRSHGGNLYHCARTSEKGDNYKGDNHV